MCETPLRLLERESCREDRISVPWMHPLDTPHPRSPHPRSSPRARGGVDPAETGGGLGGVGSAVALINRDSHRDLDAQVTEPPN